MSFTHTILHLTQPAGSQAMMAALRAVAELSPVHYAANTNECPQAMQLKDAPQTPFEPPCPATEFPELYASFAAAERVFNRG